MIARIRHANVAPVDQRGHRLPEALVALDQRDMLIREAVAMFYPGSSHREAARRLHGALDLYRCTAWLRERGERECPSRHAGRLTGHLWRILNISAHVPSEALIRKIN